jgi:hypothetical protein
MTGQEAIWESDCSSVTTMIVAVVGSHRWRQRLPQGAPCRRKCRFSTTIYTYRQKIPESLKYGTPAGEMRLYTHEGPQTSLKTERSCAHSGKWNSVTPRKSV